ncbi:MAG: carboxypeptidase regulatory-like domain-containing protein [Parcubacteria group bacterium]|nr:carboxypeptidase regulatory-like domain-containing protein [Parcubacteria group bacterium]
MLHKLFKKKFLLKKYKGFSIIEALLGIFLFTMSFYALYGVLQFSFALVAQNKAQLGAMTLADEQVEYLRSLPFGNIGVVAGNPAGLLPATESISLNGISYTRRNVIFWVDDPKDGVAPLDTISTDYKQVKIEVSWDFRGTARKIFIVTNITPKGLETNVPGGIFKITVADAATNPVQGANVNIKHAVLGVDVNRVTNSAGQWYEYGVPPGADYEITVTKPGYNSARTYGTTEAANPNPAHLTSIDDSVSQVTVFSDKISGNTVVISDMPTAGAWSDTFTDASKLSSTASTSVLLGNVELENDLGAYAEDGSATSVWIAPAGISRWTEFSWNDTAPPGTDMKYRVYYDNAGIETLVPNGKLPGNSAGLSVSPVSLAGLNDQSYGRTGYDKLKLSVSASTADTAVTPLLHDWALSYEVHAPRPNFTFNLRGMKNIGTDALGAPVDKFNVNTATDASGIMATTTLEWDTYAVSRTGYDIAESCPPQPQYIAPNTFSSTFIDMTPSLPHAVLVQVKDLTGIGDVPGAHVRLYRASSAFDQMKIAGLRCGQAFWNGLSEGTNALGNPYTIEVSAPPYTSTTTLPNIDVSGYSTYSVFTVTTS